jgi:hypothetical protein
LKTIQENRHQKFYQHKFGDFLELHRAPTAEASESPSGGKFDFTRTVVVFTGDFEVNWNVPYFPSGQLLFGDTMFLDDFGYVRPKNPDDVQFLLIVHRTDTTVRKYDAFTKEGHAVTRESRDWPGDIRDDQASLQVSVWKWPSGELLHRSPTFHGSYPEDRSGASYVRGKSEYKVVGDLPWQAVAKWFKTIYAGAKCLPTNQ